MKRIVVLMTAVVMASSVCAAEESRFISQVKISSGETVVVAEGDKEARSTGSFSVRLYDAAEPADATTFFTSGLIEERDGTVPARYFGSLCATFSHAAKAGGRERRGSV